MSCKLVEGKKSKWFPMKELKGGKLAVTQRGNIVIHVNVGSTSDEYYNEGFVILGKINNNDEDYSDGYSNDCELLVRELEEGELIEVHYS